MLKPVVQNQHVYAEALFEQPATSKPVLAYADRRHTRSQEDLRLVARARYLHPSPGFQNEVLLERMPAVPPAENARLMPGAAQKLGEIQDKRRLPRAANRDVAHAQDGHVQRAPALRT